MRWSRSNLRATLLRGPSAAPEGLRLGATLRAQPSLITYRRRYQPVPDMAGPRQPSRTRPGPVQTPLSAPTRTTSPIGRPTRQYRLQNCVERPILLAS